MILNDSIEDARFTRNQDDSSYHLFTVNGIKFKLKHDKYNSEYSIKIPSKKRRDNYVIATSNDGHVWDILVGHNEFSYGHYYKKNVYGDHIKIAQLMIGAMNEKITINEDSAVLEVPDGKSVESLPVSHFKSLIDKKGRSKIIRALTNLEVWFKNKDPKLSKWAIGMKNSIGDYGNE